MCNLYTQKLFTIRYVKSVEFISISFVHYFSYSYLIVLLFYYQFLYFITIYFMFQYFNLFDNSW